MDDVGVIMAQTEQAGHGVQRSRIAQGVRRQAVAQATARLQRVTDRSAQVVNGPSPLQTKSVATGLHAHKLSCIQDQIARGFCPGQPGRKRPKRPFDRRVKARRGGGTGGKIRNLAQGGHEQAKVQAGPPLDQDRSRSGPAPVVGFQNHDPGVGNPPPESQTAATSADCRFGCDPTPSVAGSALAKSR